MSIKTANGLKFQDQKSIRVRFQEYNPNGNGRPYEEDLTEEGYHADSIGDLPIPGDYLGLSVDKIIKGSGANTEFEKKPGVFKVLTRLFDFQVFDDKDIILCNIVVQEEINKDVIGRLVKD